MLATSYKYVDDTTIDVTLREGVHFHSGAPFSADDVVYTYNWVLSPDSGTRASGTVSRWLKSVEKLGPYQVRFHLKAVYPLALRDMRSEEHTSELQSLMRISYAVFCLQKKNNSTMT